MQPSTGQPYAEMMLFRQLEQHFVNIKFIYGTIETQKHRWGPAGGGRLGFNIKMDALAQFILESGNVLRECENVVKVRRELHNVKDMRTEIDWPWKSCESEFVGYSTDQPHAEPLLWSMIDATEKAKYRHRVINPETKTSEWMDGDEAYYEELWAPTRAAWRAPTPVFTPKEPGRTPRDVFKEFKRILEALRRVCSDPPTARYGPRGEIPASWPPMWRLPV